MEDLLKEFENPEFKINISKVIYKTYQLQELNKEYLKKILESQLQLIELTKAKSYLLITIM